MMSLKEKINAIIQENLYGMMRLKSVTEIKAEINADYGINVCLTPNDYDAVLVISDAYSDSKYMGGFIFHDRRARFTDGTFVHTSAIQETIQVTDELALVKTRNTTYLVI